MTRRLRVLLSAILILTLPILASAQTFVRLIPLSITDTISSNGDSVVLSSARMGGFGAVKVQTLDSYSGTWEVQCSTDGTNYDTGNELKLVPADGYVAVTSVTDTVGIWDVLNAGGCQSIKVIATAGFSATDTVVVISATQIGGGQSPVLANETYFSCGADNIGATLTELSAGCAAATVGANESLYITDIVAQSTTGTVGQFILRSGTGTNCGTGTASVFPSAASAVRFAYNANTVAPVPISLQTPVKVTADHGLCVLGVATQTVTIQVVGFIGRP
jgi:hypothetical protein